jgi:hypothetical protein
MIRDVNPESRIRILIFLPTPDPGFKKEPDLVFGSATLIVMTDFLAKNEQVSIPDEELIIFEAPAPVLVAHAVHLAVLGPGYQQDPADKCRIVVLMDPPEGLINGRVNRTD